MGLLVEGVWHDRWYETQETGGRFVRADAPFRDRVSAHDDTPFAPEPQRYHLYVAWACPWAHRTLIFRALKGLEATIPVSFVGPLMLDRGWEFDEEHPDRLFGHARLSDLYVSANPQFTGRVTVPVLWDCHTNTLVNNESSEIIRMFNRAFDAWAKPCPDFCPPALLPAIDAINARVYHRVNNGVYRAGFATTQTAYDEAVTALFEELDTLDALLSEQPWLCGDRLTEADWRLFPTLLRFDAVYHHHFKCSLKRLRDFPSLWSHTRALYQVPGIRETVNLPETRQHYFASHETINPHRIVPLAPVLDLEGPHDRPAWDADL